MEETEDGNCTLNIGSPETPCRKRLRDKAHEALHNQGKKMKRMAARHSGPAVLPVGAIAKLKAADVDRARIDPTSIIVVVVEVTERGMYHCATDAGVITPVFHRGDLEYMEHTTLLNHNLHLVLQNWNTLPSISIPQATRKQSVLGGQGFKSVLVKVVASPTRVHVRRLASFATADAIKILPAATRDKYFQEIWFVLFNLWLHVMVTLKCSVILSRCSYFS